MASLNYKVSLSFLGVLVFLLTYSLDYLSYSLGNIGISQLPVGAAGFIISIFLLPIFYLNKKIRISDIAMSFFFLSFLFYIMFSQYSVNTDYLFYFKMVGLFFSGILFYDYVSRNGEGFVPITKFIFILMITLTYFYSTDAFNYLRLSDAFAVTAILVLSYLKRLLPFIISVIFSTFCLYKIGSRAGLILFTAASLILIYQKYGIKTILFLIFPALSYGIYNLYNLYKNDSLDLTDNRFLRLLFTAENDTSLNERNYLNASSLETFLNNPIFGNFGLYRMKTGEGAYAHNYISYLSEFGILGLIFLLLLLFFFVNFFFREIKDKDSNYKHFILAIGIFTIIGLLFAKSVFWLLPYFVMGILYRSHVLRNSKLETSLVKN